MTGVKYNNKQKIRDSFCLLEVLSSLLRLVSNVVEIISQIAYKTIAAKLTLTIRTFISTLKNSTTSKNSFLVLIASVLSFLVKIMTRFRNNLGMTDKNFTQLTMAKASELTNCFL